MLIRGLASLIVVLALGLPQLARTVTAAPAFSHIYVIMEENTNYEDIVGNTADAPFINSLINKYSFAANYYGVTHPSEPNYLASTAGDFFGLHADDVTFKTDAQNVVDQLESKGLTWATYQQGLPSVGYTGTQYPTTGSGLYVNKHDPFVHFNDVLNSPTRLQNIKPMDALATDLASGNAPNFAFIVPDQCHDMHGMGGSSANAYGMPWCAYPPDFVVAHAMLQAADTYLKSVVSEIMGSPSWSNNSAIVVTWDENESSGQSSPNRGYSSSTGCCASPPGDGGGRVPTIVITSKASHTVSLHPYNHYSLLRTIEDNYGLGCLANTCGPSVNVMTDLFSPTSPSNGANLDIAHGFAVSFTSKNPGQGYVLFGTSCNGLVETATQDVGAGTTTHTVFVKGNDLPGSVGDIGLTPGTRYYYEVVTVGRSGAPEIDNNNGNCYAATMSAP